MVECLPSKQTVAGSSPVPRSNLRRLPGARLLQSNTWLLTPNESTDLRPVVFQFAVDKGLTVLAMSKETQSLETIFQQLPRP